MDVKQRIERRITFSASGCWIWTGKPDKHGYGRMRSAGKTRFAHRLSYEAYVGQIGDGMVIDHLCRNRMCVNPNHLDVTDRKTNIQRGAPATKLYCESGHPLFGRNLHLRRGGGRQCRECNRQSVRKYQQRIRASVNTGLTRRFP